jgi:hypothetical protein
MILWDNVFFIYTCFICASTFNANAYAHVCNCFFVQVLLVVSTHASYVCTLAFCASIFYRPYTCFLCMYFMVTYFLRKYFLSSIHMLLMHVFHVHLHFAQVFFIVHTHASYACISWTLVFCASIFFIVHTLASYACISCTLAFCVSIFYRPYTCLLCMYFCRKFVDAYTLIWRKFCLEG